jgi:hypothetical protein
MTKTSVSLVSLALVVAACIDRDERSSRPAVAREGTAPDAHDARPGNETKTADQRAVAPDAGKAHPAASLAVEREVPLPPAPARLDAPARFADVIPRLSHPFGTGLYANLVYEGNNSNMRGARLPSELYEEPDGATTAGRWRRAASSVRGVFVLRDALFSQQDHALDQRAFALAMPPSWITAAVNEVVAGRTPRPVRAPAPDDDDAWAAIATAADLFGSFPPSARLHAWACRRMLGTDADTRARIENARHAVRELAAQAEPMILAAGEGPEAVAAAGAEQVAATDRAYFGAELRRTRVIPITVENPNRHEIEDEGKGFEVAGRDVSGQAIAIARDALLRRRLRDGDLALERYDLSRPEERRRAIALLERLVPADVSGAAPPHRLWLWVTGPLEENEHRGVDATAYIATFHAEVARANVDSSRLRYVSKPYVDLPRTGRGRALVEAADRMRALGLPLSVNLGTAALGAAIRDAP